ncbi:MAG: polyphosphate kinase 1, partial [Raoultibacter sp.]
PELNEEQLAYLHEYFERNLMPFLSPQIINARHPFPHLENGALYVVVRLDEEAKEKKRLAEDKVAKDNIAEKTATKQDKRDKNLGAEGVTLGIIPMRTGH